MDGGENDCTRELHAMDVTSCSVGDEQEFIDVWIALKLKQARLERGLSQKDLAEKLGLSLQQIHKYEGARNRIGASRLIELANTLGKSVDFFFEGLVDSNSDSGDADVSDPWSRQRARECLELVRNFNRIEDAAKREAILGFLQALDKMGN